MKKTAYLLTVIALAGYSSLGSLQNQESRGPIAFSSAEHLTSHPSTREDVIRLIGKPDEIKTLQDGTESWTYLERESENVKSQRLNLVLDSKTKQLVSITWLPREGEALYNEKNVLAHFSEAQFKMNKVGWIADSYSGDLTYQDRARGISLYVSETRREVEFIGLTPPQAREPANLRR